MSKTETDLDSITEQLGKTCFTKEEGVSFAGQSMKLDTKTQAQVVVDQINACPNLEYLNLEGNTLGIEAAEAIGKALESKSELKKALWKDMFTGRMKNEIPTALKALGKGLITAKAQLEVLDLSDNASGPIGVEGIIDLIKSPTCYTLKELKLNNMGLGVAGAKLLASALMDCYKKSKEAGKPLALKVFIAGRNRLENEGTKALALVFEALGSLEEIQIPQNGIYRLGIEALSRALACNPRLKEINLNDNTINPEGSAALSEAITKLQSLVKLDLGDCLLKTRGAEFLAKSLKEGHYALEELVVSFNSIKISGGVALAEAVMSKPRFKRLIVDGNKFGTGGKGKMKQIAETAEKVESLGCMSDDEGSDESDDEEDYGNTPYSDDSCESDVCSEGDEEEEEEKNDVESTTSSSEPSSGAYPDNISSGLKLVSAKEFLENPTYDNLVGLGNDPVTSIVSDIKMKPYNSQLDELMEAIVKVSSIVDPQCNLLDKKIATSWEMNTSLELYQKLFEWARQRNALSFVNNALPVHLSLIKDEETRKPKSNQKLGGCIHALKYLMTEEDIFPKETVAILHMLIKAHQDKSRKKN
ncbi:ran GTPase-activating protein 1 isoform X1 [Halyomorpha halys]|uniref:ran GTPase-activating protein 1 isoform X1 n=1 Tax=Halyomorpha halys TaxID=286706 RepID=UPI0006D5226B|nr:ran GTPase-activating protein 1 isoform X1 [Halyomorpha halys]